MYFSPFKIPLIFESFPVTIGTWVFHYKCLFSVIPRIQDSRNTSMGMLFIDKLMEGTARRL